MLSPKAQLSLRNAREYFREHLSVGDYYAEGQTVAGEWLGLGAEKLGLKDTVSEDAFLALCDGLNPATGRRMTQRRNTVRHDGASVASNRRVFYDFTISPPKSVSVVALYQDPRIVELHNEAVRRAVTELEKFAEARVRKSGKHDDRVTGNLVVATFRHDTSRELDPHLHTHCIAFNATFDPVENRWKALHASGMYRAQKFAENYYYHELAKGLRSLGYEIKNNARDFEIKGVPASLIARFSKRHQQIDIETQRRLETESQPTNIKTLREQVARDERKRKIKASTADRLRPMWARQLTEEERFVLDDLRMATTPAAGSKSHAIAPPVPSIVSNKHEAHACDLLDIIAWADEHLFERRAVVHDYELWSAALARGRGENFDLVSLTHAVEAAGYIREDGTRKLTTRGLLRCEFDVVLAAKEGRLAHEPFANTPKLSPSLSSEQRIAVNRIFASRDFITLFRGGAGTGKSFTLKEVERGLSAASHPVVVLAPQRQQVHDLQQDGLAAQTLAHVLATKSLPSRCVVLLDEAGQVGGRELHALVKLIQSQRGRLILSGDTRQQGAVTASDALRSIETYAGLRAAEIRSIRRQDPRRARSIDERKFIRGYRAAIKAAASGDVADSFDRLDRLGCVHESTASDDRHVALAEEYCAALERGERPLAVAQTWAEVHRANEAIRNQLIATGHLSTGQPVTSFQPLNWDEAQKCDPRFYQAGHHAVFLKRYGRFQRGDVCEITDVNERGLTLLKNGRHSSMSFRYADRIIIAAATSFEVASGDRFQLKLNGRSCEGHAFNNGDLVTVRKLHRDGSLSVTDSSGTIKTLTAAQRVFTRGYAVTSYASQGKTVDTVLLSDSACRATTNSNQWYVAISRARRKVVIFTPDKAALREHIQRSGDRELALDIAPASEMRHLTHRRRLLAGIERVRLFHTGRHIAKRHPVIAQRHQLIHRS
ncbi:conjugative relaxase [Opitutaceae bacterium TAV4]|nr:conjugative relaxase [Opitutaceae bacterium TAV4]RRK02001.1 conjugative relaxase [Opitutaceae bacterium TAV3]